MTDKTPDVVKALGGAGAREKFRKADARRLTDAYNKRTYSPTPPAGACIHPGCHQPAIVGRYCGLASHYCPNYLSRPGWWQWTGKQWVNKWGRAR